MVYGAPYLVWDIGDRDSRLHRSNLDSPAVFDTLVDKVLDQLVVYDDSVLKRSVVAGRDLCNDQGSIGEVDVVEKVAEVVQSLLTDVGIVTGSGWSTDWTLAVVYSGQVIDTSYLDMSTNNGGQPKIEYYRE